MKDIYIQRDPSITKVDILGTTWKIIFEDTTNIQFYEFHNGWCDNSTKECHIGLRPPLEYGQKDQREFVNMIARHEIVHAFLYESGIVSSQLIRTKEWAVNETMIDWMAIQTPKIFKVFEEVEIL
jgi:hypothetical protein|nr:MAG TPA: hypothetical protein [Caudoviricetes sp.]